jgi:hypothetical protein
MLLPKTAHWLRRAGLHIVAVDAIGHYLPWPGRPWHRVSSRDGIPVLRWLALHSIVVAEKP